MKIKHFSAIDPSDIFAISELIDTCTEYDSLTLSFPYDDEDTDFFLEYVEDTLVSILVLCEIDNLTYECIAWTHPSKRCLGYFSSIWSYALKFLIELVNSTSYTNIKSPSISNNSVSKLLIDFIYDHRCASALPAIISTGAIHIQDEIKMSALIEDIALKDMESYSPKLDIVINDCGNQHYTITQSTLSHKNSKLIHNHKTKTSTIAKFSIIPCTKDTSAYLYEFEVKKNMRGQGLGKIIFANIISFLKEKNYSTISLQVSASNIPALKIYKNSGLETGVILSYYEIKPLL